MKNTSFSGFRGPRVKNALEIAQKGALTMAFILSLLMGFSAHAQEVKKTDTFDPSIIAQKGWLKGKPIPTEIYRSIQILVSEPNRMVIANFRHAGHFWMAEFNPTAVKDIYVQINRFKQKLPLGHAQLRFQMEESSPIILWPQSGTSDGLQPLLLKDMVFTVEAVRVKGQEYSALKGAIGYYFPAVYRFLSLNEKYQDHFANKNYPWVRQVKLKLTETERASVLVEAAKLSHKQGMKDMYNTVIQNCATELFVVFENALPSVKAHPFKRKVSTWLGFNPVWSELALRHLDLSAGRVPNLDVEFPSAPLVQELRHVPNREMAK